MLRRKEKGVRREFKVAEEREREVQSKIASEKKRQVFRIIGLEVIGTPFFFFFALPLMIIHL